MQFFRFFLAALLILGIVFLDHSTLGWGLERPILEFLAKKTGRPLPQVTAVILPLSDSLLAPQDVALTLRACGGFYPRSILVAAPIGDFTNGPFSLIREGIDTGFVQGIPFSYNPNFEASTASVWSAKVPLRVLALDDFLLKREEMERGVIRPELPLFFHDQTVLLGGPAVVAQAECLQSEQERCAVHLLPAVFYGLMFLVVGLGSLFTLSWGLLDFALVMTFFCLCYAAGTFFLFRWQGVLLPLFLPSGLLLLVFLKKLIPSCAAEKEG